MNKSALVCLWALAAWGGISRQATAAIIPDGNPSGLSQTQTINSSITAITSVTVHLDISSEFTGDIYAYLTHGSSIAILLNRPGSTAGNPFGYGDSTGYQITLSDAAANDIHLYQNVVIPASGSPLTGNWQPDARNVDPNSVTDTSSRTAFLSVFNGQAASGDWTLFVADMSSGGVSALNSWSLDFTGRQTAVPEPGTYLAGLFILVPLSYNAIRHLRRPKEASAEKA